MSYSSFAAYYDSLTKNVQYEERAEYFCALLARLGHAPGLTLDLACGTGSLTLALAARGVDVYGVDSSMEMLSEAQRKAAEQGRNLLFLCQRMQNLDLFGTVDTVICTLDSINHLNTEQEILKTFEKVSLFLDPGGIFVFDVNTPYKHAYVLGDNAYIYDTEHVFCAWQNHYEKATGRVHIQLDFFAKEDGLYRRSSESFYERAYSVETLFDLLRQAGLEPLAVYNDLAFDAPTEHAERVVITAKKAC